MDKNEKIAALCEAVSQGDVAYAQRVLDDGVHPDATQEPGITPLALATANGDLPMMECLLGAGADVNFPCDSGMSILSLAIQKANLDALGILLAKGADPNRRLFEGERTVLHMAAVMGLADIIKALVKSGADVDQMDKSGYNAIMMAIGAGKQQAVEALLSCGAKWPDKPGADKKSSPKVIELGMK